jgi:hypothetical protein
MNGEFRVIPGYSSYGVDQQGMIVSYERDLVLKQYLVNGYLIVDTFRGSATETLPVHRAVALAWVENPKSGEFTIVNHKDGDPLNNWYENLEWTDYSGNNYHAVNNGLRVDNIPCKVRDFETRDVHEFSSIAQAAEFMGLHKATPMAMLKPKQFGRLIADRYEFRFTGDPTPWFYQDRSERVKPSRYMVVVRDSDGSCREIYSTKALLKEYQLYKSPNLSIPGLAAYGNEIYPDKEFIVHDSYSVEPYRVLRMTRDSKAIKIKAISINDSVMFSSLTQCAKHFDVDRSTIWNRLNNGKELDGWTFTSEIASLLSND